jgi:hypothetical protein
MEELLSGSRFSSSWGSEVSDRLVYSSQRGRLPGRANPGSGSGVAANAIDSETTLGWPDSGIHLRAYPYAKPSGAAGERWKFPIRGGSARLCWR